MEVIYRYDGSFEGFLCCVFDSYVHKEFPISFYGDEDCCTLNFRTRPISPRVSFPPAGWEPTDGTPNGFWTVSGRSIPGQRNWW